MKVRVEAPVRPTEDPQRVEEAAARFVPDATMERREDVVVVEGASLEALRKRVWELRIIDAFRGMLLGGSAGRTLTFRTSKQAAYAGRVSIPPTPHPLGDLMWTVTLEEDDPWPDAEALAWWVCPETSEGEIVGPVD